MAREVLSRTDPSQQYALCDRLAEEAVIAAILLDESEVVQEGVASILTADMFWDDGCRAAYKGWLWCREQGLEPTVVTVRRAWIELGWIDSLDRTLGVPAEVWLADVLGKYFTAVGVEAHARIIRDLHARRNKVVDAQLDAMAAYAGMPSRHGVSVGARSLFR